MKILSSWNHWVVKCEIGDVGLWQEFWVGNEELVNMYERRLGDAGYMNFKLARTNNRGDGMLSYLSFFVFFWLIRVWSIEGLI